MHIVNILRRFAFEEWGGTETVVWNTARELLEMKHDFEIVSTSALSHPGEEYQENVSIKRFEYFYPLFPLTPGKVRVLDKKGGNPFSFGMSSYLHSLDNADMFHCHTMGRIADSVRRAAQSLGKPYVVSLHGGQYDVPKQEIEEMMKPYKLTFNYGKFLDILHGNKHERFLVESDGIICVGHNEYNIVKERFPDKPVAMIPNGVYLERFREKVEPKFRKANLIAKDTKVILCVSRIDYQKNQKILIELAARLIKKGENIRLVLIGPVTAKGYYESMKSLIEELKIAEHVNIIKGLLPHSHELIDAYLSADLFVLPSVHEPFGIVALEAWAAGLPLIASDVGGLKYLVRDGENGLIFDHNSVDDLEKCYFKLMGDKELQEKFQEKGFGDVVENYTWNAVSRKLLDFYDEVITKKKEKK